MKSSLSSRLDLIRRASGTGQKNPVSRKTVMEIPGWEKKSEYVFFRKKMVALEDYSDSLIYPNTEIEPRRLCFFDTETTGLSSGAGTVIFLAGTLRQKNNVLELCQYFLADYPGERAFLDLLLNDLNDDSIYVTYNGKAFDFSLLKTRLLMNGLHRDFPEQIDLLHPMRRLMKTIHPSCSQKDCEEVFLSLQRKDDVPGSLVPFLYRKFLSTSDASVLLPVFRHHFSDIENLSRLFFWFQALLKNPTQFTLCNLFELSRLVTVCDRNKGLKFMKKIADSGNIQAIFYLSLVWKKEGQIEESVSVWKKLEAQNHFHALLELAKYAEHKCKDTIGALSFAKKAFGCIGLTAGQKRTAAKRIERLTLKNQFPKNPNN